MMSSHTDGHKVLVVEDECVFSLDLARTMERAGMQVLGPVRTHEAALQILEQHGDLSGAVLDVVLQGRAIYTVAMALRKRGVPFAFVSGARRDVIAPDFRDAAYLEKPVAASRVVLALQREMARASASIARAPAGTDA